MLDLLEREHSIYKFRHIVMKEQNKFQKHALNSQEYFNMFSFLYKDIQKFIDEVLFTNKQSNTKVNEEAIKVVAPKAVLKCIAYAAANEISIIDNTLYIAGAKLGRASDWYDAITQVPTLWTAASIVN